MVVWLIPTLLTLHNAEEAVAFRRMWTRGPGFLPQPFAALEARLSHGLMLQALAGLSLLAFLLAAFVSMRPRSHVALWLLLALEAAVAINVMAHVVSAVLVFKGYAPGLGTALAVNAPFAWYVLRRARNDGWVSRSAWRGLFPAGLLLHGPVLIGALWLLATFAA